MTGFLQAEHILAEDVPSGDLTTEALGFGTVPARITFTARGAMVPCGLGTARRIIEAVGGRVEFAARDGDRACAGDMLLDAFGTAAALHRAWKVSQTLVEIASGIASATADLVTEAASVDPMVRVACTRKTVPGARLLSQDAVRAGGGILHRHGLSETILVFAEHRAFLPDETLASLAAKLRAAQPEKAIGIEVHTVADAVEAVRAGFDTVQLEKFSPSEVAEVRSTFSNVCRPPVLAAAGGIDPSNAADYARAGARLLVTSWPYTAKPRDVGIRIVPVAHPG